MHAALHAKLFFRSLVMEEWTVLIKPQVLSPTVQSLPNYIPDNMSKKTKESAKFPWHSLKVEDNISSLVKFRFGERGVWLFPGHVREVDISTEQIEGCFIIGNLHRERLSFYLGFRRTTVGRSSETRLLGLRFFSDQLQPIK